MLLALSRATYASWPGYRATATTFSRWEARAIGNRLGITNTQAGPTVIVIQETNLTKAQGATLTYDGAKTSLDVRVESFTDPALVTALANRAKAGVAVRVALTAGKSTQKAALIAAGIAEVKLADGIIAWLVVADAKSAILDGSSFESEAIDFDRTQLIHLENAEITGKAKFDATWAAAQ